MNLRIQNYSMLGQILHYSQNYLPKLFDHLHAKIPSLPDIASYATKEMRMKFSLNEELYLDTSQAMYYSSNLAEYSVLMHSDEHASYPYVHILNIHEIRLNLMAD
jgi:hypothetical protein